MISTSTTFMAMWNGKPDMGTVVWWSTVICGPGYMTAYHTPTKPTARQVRKFIKLSKSEQVMTGVMDGALIDFKTTNKHSVCNTRQLDLYDKLLEGVRTSLYNKKLYRYNKKLLS